MLADKKKQLSLFVFLLFPFWTFIYAILALVSWLLAFANDEGTINEFLGTVGHYCFLIFRFPSHNFFWDDRQFIMENYFALLLVNALFYSVLTTVAISLYLKKKAQRIPAVGSPKKGLFSEDVKKNEKRGVKKSTAA